MDGVIEAIEALAQGIRLRPQQVGDLLGAGTFHTTMQQVGEQRLGLRRGAVGNVPLHWCAVLAVDTQVAEASDFPAMPETVRFGFCGVSMVDNGQSWGGI